MEYEKVLVSQRQERNSVHVREKYYGRLFYADKKPQNLIIAVKLFKTVIEKLYQPLGTTELNNLKFNRAVTRSDILHSIKIRTELRS